MTRCPEQTTVAAYALGVLDPEELRRMDEHLAGCPVCRAELADLEGLPDLLAKVHGSDLPAEHVVPSDLAYQRLRRAAEERRPRGRRMNRVLVAAGAAVLVLSGSLGVAALLTGGDQAATSVVSAAAGPVHARATVAAVPTGTRVALWLSGVPQGARCRLVAITHDGRRETASTWTATYQGEASVTGSLSVKPSQIDRFVVETLDGQHLLTMPAPTA